MQVLTFGGTRLIEAEELRVIPYVQDTRPKESGFKPVESFGWSNSVTENRWRYAVAALNGVSKASSIQIGRICRTYDEADGMFKNYIRSGLNPCFFFDEYVQFKTERAERESTSKAKPLPKTAIETPILAIDPDKDTTVTIEG